MRALSHKLIVVVVCVGVAASLAAPAGASVRRIGETKARTGTESSLTSTNSSSQEDFGMEEEPETLGGVQGKWYDSIVYSGNTYNCTIIGGGYYEPLGMSYVGWYGNYETGNANTTIPRVGDVYYTRVGWGITGYPCGSGGAYVHVEMNLPANTQLAISPTNKVRCYYHSIHAPDGQYSEFTNDTSSCPQQPQNGVQGGYSFDPADGSGAWPTASTAAYELWIPVKTTRELTSGYSASGPCSACVQAGVWMIDGSSSPWSYPRSGVWVDGGPPPTPSISYPIPSVTNLEYSPDPAYPDFPSRGRTEGYIYSEGTTGHSYFELGPTKDYGTKSPDFAISSPDNWHVWQDWRMKAGKTWHWRLCYKPQGQPVVCGVDQSFETAPPPDNQKPNTTIKGTSGPVKTTTAKFTLSSNELNVTYMCNLDGAGFQPCSSSTPTFQALGEGPHSLSVYAKDAAGNEDATPAVANWRVDLTRPQTTITDGPSGTVGSRDATFKFKSSELNSKFLCSLDGAQFKACASPKTYQDLARKQHTFKVKAKDPAGNIDKTPAEAIWKIT
jgi:hypothetical protein